jgi:predicted phosphodiesterase
MMLPKSRCATFTLAFACLLAACGKADHRAAAPTGARGAPAAGSASGTGVAGARAGDIATDANLKVGFIGDTGSGPTFTSVLHLVKNEGASALVVEGDMSYSAEPAEWWGAVESVLGSSYPVFIARGNHDDSSWSGYLPKAREHLGGATREPGTHDASYKTNYKGLVVATIMRGDTAATLSSFLHDDPHLWKICSWHQNQEAMQLGGKGDEMGWDVYETCRKEGAIIETGHEHTYERTKALTNTATQTVDSSCAGASVLCVGSGRTFVNVVGLGGESIRDQVRCLPATPPYGCNGEWAFVYTNQQGATYGAQFITFTVGGAPKRASGYFKNIDGQTVDTFTITHD